MDDAVAAAPKHGDFEGLATTIPETILDYLRRVNPDEPQIENRLKDDVMIQAAKRLAQLELGNTFLPGNWVDRAEVGDRLETFGFQAVDTILDRLKANGVLGEDKTAGTSRVRFALDPVAEYLAAIQMVTDCSHDAAAWAGQLDKVENADKFPAQQRGFVNALDVCVRTYQQSFRIPESVLSRIADWQDALSAEPDRQAPSSAA